MIRCGWFDEGSDNFEITKNGQYFKGNDISRQFICYLVLKLDQRNGLEKAFGINSFNNILIIIKIF